MKDKIEIMSISKNPLNKCFATLKDGRKIRITYLEYENLYKQFFNDKPMVIERDVESVSFSDQKIIAKYTNKTARELTHYEYNKIQKEFYNDDEKSM